MPLVDMRSNLANLRYDLDRLGGGWSGQPFVQFVNPNVATPSSLQTQLNNQLLFGSDFPMRGGQTLNLGAQTLTSRGELDVFRIRQFFKTTRGKLFLDKQTGLQLSNPRIQTGKALSLGGSFGLPNLLENTRVFNRGTNMLSQIGATGTGVHYPRHGAIPFDFNSKYYFDIVNEENVTNDPKNNRLILLYDTKMLGKSGNLSLMNSLGISTNRNVMFNYLGGPSSVYGLGSTLIRRYQDTTASPGQTMNYSQLSSQVLPEVGITDLDQDFRSNLKNYVNSNIVWKKENTIQNRIGVGRPGTKKDSRAYVNYTASIAGAVDLLNQQGVFTSTGDPYTEVNDGVYNKDIIKFGFKAINNDNPSEAEVILFRAFLSSPITDNNAATLSAFKYLGRGENFYTYQGFDRSISFSFRVAAQSRSEMVPIYQKLNRLMSQVYPDYGSNSSVPTGGGAYMRAPVIKLTMGDYLYRVPGFLENVNFTIPQEASWEINLENDKSMGQLPQVVEVAITFKPIMDILPRKETKGSKVPLIFNTP